MVTKIVVIMITPVKMSGSCALFSILGSERAWMVLFIVKDSYSKILPTCFLNARNTGMELIITPMFAAAIVHMVSCPQ